MAWSAATRSWRRSPIRSRTICARRSAISSAMPNCSPIAKPRPMLPPCNYMRTIKQAVLAAGRLVDDLLHFSQLGRTPLSIGIVDIEKLAAEVRRSLATEAGGRRGRQWGAFAAGGRDAHELTQSGRRAPTRRRFTRPRSVPEPIPCGQGNFRGAPRKLLRNKKLQAPGREFSVSITGNLPIISGKFRVYGRDVDEERYRNKCRKSTPDPGLAALRQVQDRAPE